LKIIKPYWEIIYREPRITTLKIIANNARVCYQSEGNFKRAEDDKKLVKNLVKLGHGAMLEFSDVIVKFVADRGFVDELTRHRIASFAVESTRWCNYFKKDIEFIEPINLKEESIKAYNEWANSCVIAEIAYKKMIENGCTPQIARSVLPLSIKSEIRIKTNLREWMHIFSLRTTKNAHPFMRSLLLSLQEDFKRWLPEVFGEAVK
jgi:thymidylate synthase (FAD)